jgi:NADPH:quinone reductase
MKAIRVRAAGGPEVLAIEDVPAPTPGPGELLIDVEAIGVNFIEVYQRRGLYPITLPFTPGSEAAGVVRAIGEGVPADFVIGERIVSQSVKGAYAEQAVVPAAKAVQTPAGLESRRAAAVFLQGLTANYLSTSTFPLNENHRCLIHAIGGGVGLLLCQMAKQLGAFVIGTASSPEKLELAKAMGADVTINYTTERFPEVVRRVTNGEGVHVVYDSVGKTTFDDSLDCLVPRGMMVLFGQSSGPVPPFDPQILNRKGSLFLTRPTLNDYVRTRVELLDRAEDLLLAANMGDLEVRIGAEFSLEAAADAHRALESRGTTGKVVLVP